MKRTLMACTALVLCLTGCAAFNKEVAPRVAQAVSVYCMEPAATRALIRAQVAELAKPNAIQVQCAADATGEQP
jgi:hypothetical protein